MSTANGRVSIVVPVYNVVDLLDRCVMSLLAQHHEDVEVVLVDDGSTDASGQLCDLWLQRDNRIVVIHQSNGGLAKARNVGIDAASGEFICFVDSDDYVGADHVSRMFRALSDVNADVAISRFQRTTGSTPAASASGAPAELLSGTEALRRLVGADAMMFTVAWGKLSRRTLWAGLRFPEGRLHEDEFVSYRLMERARLVAVLQESTYYYFIRPGSITETPLSAKRYFDLAEALQARTDRFWELGLKPEALELRRAMLRRSMSVQVQEAVSIDRATKRRWSRLARECARWIVQYDTQLAVRLFGVLAWISPPLARAVFQRGSM